VLDNLEVVVNNLGMMLNNLVPEVDNLVVVFGSFTISSVQLHNHAASQLILCRTMNATRYITW
jgi:hypothetical protein